MADDGLSFSECTGSSSAVTYMTLILSHTPLSVYNNYNNKFI